MYKLERDYEGDKLTLETGKVARRSSAAVWIQHGDNIVLATCVIAPTVKSDLSFVPLTVNYTEKAYAAGKIPGGFFKREGRPTDAEVLASRIIDRSVRPLFPKSFRQETQIIVSVLSASDPKQPAILGIIGASLGLAMSDPVFNKLVAGVRVGRVDGELVINPTNKQLELSDLDIVVAGNRDGITMMEGESGRVSETDIMDSLKASYESILKLLDMGEEFLAETGTPEQRYLPSPVAQELIDKVRQFAAPRIDEIRGDWSKEQKDSHIETIRQEILQNFLPLYPERDNELVAVLAELKKNKLRQMTLQDGIRWDGRAVDEVRQISGDVGVLPRVHGSAVFTRGETQSLVVTTLGTSSDEQRIDGLQQEEIKKSFMFHYNFPPFSTGETRRLMGPGRREVGHGFLAERALAPVLPQNDTFPYTIRLVSDILESNGSSSMASVCGGSLSLMDGGVPILEPVAGISIGLIAQDGQETLLTDILGTEDYLGDMDFKVAGTRSGITALQLDIKTDKVSFELLGEALNRAKVAREKILDVMDTVLAEPRSKLAKHAPRIATLPIAQDKIGDIIGPGGRVIKKIIQETGASIDVNDTEGKVTVSSMSEEATEQALGIIKSIIQDLKVGQIYDGVVKRVTNFGAFVEVAPGKEGLVHISELSNRYIKNAADVVSVGDKVSVKLIGIDHLGRVNLSRKQATKKED